MLLTPPTWTAAPRSDPPRSWRAPPGTWQETGDTRHWLRRPLLGRVVGVPLRLLVIDSQEVFRIGLVTSLQAGGFTVEDAADPAAAGCAPVTADVVVAVVREVAELYVVAHLVGDCAVPVVGLLDRTVIEHGARALRGGLTAVLATDTASAVICAAVELAAAGVSAVPRALVEDLLAQAASTSLSLEERNWLTELAAGHTVVELAVRHGWSERSVYRMLREVYDRLGAANRGEAVAIASRDGLL